MANEGISKAWISNIAPKGETATAIGTFTVFQNIFTMMASALAGLLWYNFNATVAFLVTAIAALITALYFIVVVYLKQFSLLYLILIND